jgi:hypothetical protein
MNENEQQVCPWCQMEIIWDPEIGPEEECPHCLNQLTGYRTLPLNSAVEDEDDDEAVYAGSDTKSDEDNITPVDLNQPLEEDELDDYEDLLEESKAKDSYQESVMQCLDTQLEVPECFRCQDLMLFAGVQRVDPTVFVPEIPVALGQSFLPKRFELQLYVCPSCFATESMLSPDDRELMVKIIKGIGSNKLS